MHLSIRARLTFWYTGILAATLLLLAAVAYGLLLRGLWHDVDTTLQGVATTLAQTAERSADYFPSDMDEVLRRFFGPSLADKFYQFLDPRGRLDPRWPQFRGQPFQVTPKALANAKEGYATFETVAGPGRYPTRVLTFPVVVRGRMVNVLQVGMSLEPLHMARRHFLWSLAALMPVALLLAGGGGWLLARRALRPVDQMTTAARRIEAEHLAQRLDGAEVNDELGRLARTLNEMLARLESRFEQVRRFSADASHELRTPLTVLKGEIEVALRTQRSAEEYRRVLASTLEEVERMARMVDELLLLSRADAGALRWESEQVELDRLVEEVAKQADVLARPKEVRVSLTEMAPLMVRGDAHRLKQLLLNLADNAVKYTGPGGQVSLGLRAVTAEGRPAEASAEDQGTGEYAEIVVRDTGVGISADDLPRIFERFYRADPARSRQAAGAGLGLCISKTIAEAHGGRIEVQSAPGVGSTFRVLLPLQAS
jgi:heavy metal sensor kinase